MLDGATLAEVEPYYQSPDMIRRIERASIHEFMIQVRDAGHLGGRTLDFGCGTQPYRSLVRGEYIPYDISNTEHEHAFGPGRQVDTIICNQVIQYLQDPQLTVNTLVESLRVGGRFVITFPANWDVVEDSDLFRFTKSGVKLLMHIAGLRITSVMLRAQVIAQESPRFSFPLGYGMIFKK